MPLDRLTYDDVQKKLSDCKSVLSTMYAFMVEDQGDITWASGSSDEGNRFAHDHIKGFSPDYNFKLAPLAWLGVQTLLDHVMTGEVPGVRYVLPDATHRDDEKAKEHVDEIQD